MLTSLLGKKLGAGILGLLCLGACLPLRGTAGPEDYYALAQRAMDGGRVAAMISRNQALSTKNAELCVASDVAEAALKSAKSGLKKAGDSIPGFDIELDECLALRTSENTFSEVDAEELLETVVGVALVAAAHYAAKLQATDCRKGTLALAAVGFVEEMASKITEELANPDGKLSVPAMAVDYSTCSAA